MMLIDIIAGYSENRTKQIVVVCGQNVDFLNFKAGAAYSNHYASEAYVTSLMSGRRQKY